jgi:ribosomal protein L10
VDAAASIAGVTPRTIWRWLSDDELFVEEYRRARQQAVDNAIAGLQGVMAEAVETLRRNLNARNASIQVRSAIALIELGLKATERAELEQRIEELERSYVE